MAAAHVAPSDIGLLFVVTVNGDVTDENVQAASGKFLADQAGQGDHPVRVDVGGRGGVPMSGMSMTE